MRTKIPKFPQCEHMTEKDWLQNLSMGVFNKYDGSGYWATDKFYDRAFSAFQVQPNWATHVVWFNK